MEVHNSTWSEYDNWLPKTCRFTKGHAPRVQKVHFFTLVGRRLDHLPVLELTVGQVYDYVVNKLLLATREKLAEPPNELAEQLLDQLVL